MVTVYRSVYKNVVTNCLSQKYQQAGLRKALQAFGDKKGAAFLPQ